MFAVDVRVIARLEMPHPPLTVPFGLAIERLLPPTAAFAAAVTGIERVTPSAPVTISKPSAFARFASNPPDVHGCGDGDCVADGRQAVGYSGVCGGCPGNPDPDSEKNTGRSGPSLAYFHECILTDSCHPKW